MDKLDEGPTVEEEFRWKANFGGRQPSVEDDLWWKMTFGGKQPLMEEDMTFGGDK